MSFLPERNPQTLPQRFGLTPASSNIQQPNDPQSSGSGNPIAGFAKSAFLNLASGEQAFNTLLPGDAGTEIKSYLDSQGRAGKVAGFAFDTLLSPITIAEILAIPFTGGASGALLAGTVGATRAARFTTAASAARAAQTVARPVAKVGKALLVDGVPESIAARSAASRMGYVAGRNLAIDAAATKTIEALPEDSPGAVKLGLGLFGGVVAFKASDLIGNMASARMIPGGVARPGLKSTVPSSFVIEANRRNNWVARSSEHVGPERAVGLDPRIDTTMPIYVFENIDSPSVFGAPVNAVESAGSRPNIDSTGRITIETDQARVDALWADGIGQSQGPLTTEQLKRMQEAFVDNPNADLVQPAGSYLGNAEHYSEWLGIHSILDNYPDALGRKVMDRPSTKNMDVDAPEYVLAARNRAAQLQSMTDEIYGEVFQQPTQKIWGTVIDLDGAASGSMATIFRRLTNRQFSTFTSAKKMLDGLIGRENSVQVNVRQSMNGVRMQMTQTIDNVFNLLERELGAIKQAENGLYIFKRGDGVIRPVSEVMRRPNEPRWGLSPDAIAGVNALSEMVDRIKANGADVGLVPNALSTRGQRAGNESTHSFPQYFVNPDSSRSVNDISELSGTDGNRYLVEGSNQTSLIDTGDPIQGKPHIPYKSVPELQAEGKVIEVSPRDALRHWVDNYTLSYEQHYMARQIERFSGDSSSAMGIVLAKSTFGVVEPKSEVQWDEIVPELEIANMFKEAMGHEVRVVRVANAVDVAKVTQRPQAAKRQTVSATGIADFVWDTDGTVVSTYTDSVDGSQWIVVNEEALDAAFNSKAWTKDSIPNAASFAEDAFTSKGEYEAFLVGLKLLQRDDAIAAGGANRATVGWDPRSDLLKDKARTALELPELRVIESQLFDQRPPTRSINWVTDESGVSLIDYDPSTRVMELNKQGIIDEFKNYESQLKDPTGPYAYLTDGIPPGIEIESLSAYTSYLMALAKGDQIPAQALEEMLKVTGIFDIHAQKIFEAADRAIVNQGTVSTLSAYTNEALAFAARAAGGGTGGHTPAGLDLSSAGVPIKDAIDVGVPRQRAKEYTDLLNSVLRAEKFDAEGDRLAQQFIRQGKPLGDEFSRARGYTRKEIADLHRLNDWDMEMIDSGVVAEDDLMSLTMVYNQQKNNLIAEFYDRAIDVQLAQSKFADQPFIDLGLAGAEAVDIGAVPARAAMRVSFDSIDLGRGRQLSFDTRRSFDEMRSQAAKNTKHVDQMFRNHLADPLNDRTLAPRDIQRIEKALFPEIKDKGRAVSILEGYNTAGTVPLAGFDLGGVVQLSPFLMGSGPMGPIRAAIATYKGLRAFVGGGEEQHARFLTEPTTQKALKAGVVMWPPSTATDFTLPTGLRNAISKLPIAPGIVKRFEHAFSAGMNIVRRDAYIAESAMRGNIAAKSGMVITGADEAAMGSAINRLSGVPNSVNTPEWEKWSFFAAGYFRSQRQLIDSVLNDHEGLDAAIMRQYMTNYISTAMAISAAGALLDPDRDVMDVVSPINMKALAAGDLRVNSNLGTLRVKNTDIDLLGWMKPIANLSFSAVNTATGLTASVADQNVNTAWEEFASGLSQAIDSKGSPATRLANDFLFKNGRDFDGRSVFNEVSVANRFMPIWFSSGVEVLTDEGIFGTDITNEERNNVGLTALTQAGLDMFGARASVVTPYERVNALVLGDTDLNRYGATLVDISDSVRAAFELKYPREFEQLARYQENLSDSSVRTAEQRAYIETEYVKDKLKTTLQEMYSDFASPTGQIAYSGVRDFYQRVMDERTSAARQVGDIRDRARINFKSDTPAGKVTSAFYDSYDIASEGLGGQVDYDMLDALHAQLRTDIRNTDKYTAGGAGERKLLLAILDERAISNTGVAYIDDMVNAQRFISTTDYYSVLDTQTAKYSRYIGNFLGGDNVSYSDLTRAVGKLDMMIRQAESSGSRAASSELRQQRSLKSIKAKIDKGVSDLRKRQVYRSPDLSLALSVVGK